MDFDTSKNVYALVTSTTYGTWLHGDQRGFVGRIRDENGNEVIHNEYGTPCDADMLSLQDRDRKRLKTPPVLLSREQAETILSQWKETADYLGWSLFAVAVMSNHFHVALSAPVGTDKTELLKKLKSYASRALNKKFGQIRWWTDSGSVRFSFDQKTFETRIRYVLNQENPLIIWSPSSKEAGASAPAPLRNSPQTERGLTPPPLCVPVALGDKSYEIEIGTDNLRHVGDFLASFVPVSLAVVLTDRNVHDLGYAERVAESISESGIDATVLSIESGEQSKAIETAAALWNTLLEDGVDRKAVLVAVGGGVIGDLGGFVAATYARGIRFFQVPTTLLAQVDSSVGGKVGIDLPGAKNMVGAFHQPLGVLVDTKVLDTLPEEQFLSGLGEVVKYGLSLDENLLRFLEENATKIKNRDHAALGHLVAESCRIKAQIVAEDEFETTGRRILLNYGHTFGHAFEILSDFSLLHGLAVAAGSICAARLALRLGLIDRELLDRHLALFRSLGLPTEVPAGLDWKKAVELMRRDKKTEFGRLRFVLPNGPGRCAVIDDVDPTKIME